MSAFASKPLAVELKSVPTQLSRQETRNYNARRQGPKPLGTVNAKRRFEKGHELGFILI